MPVQDMHPVKSHIQQRIQAIWFYIQKSYQNCNGIAPTDHCKRYKNMVFNPGRVFVLTNAPSCSVSLTNNGLLFGVGADMGIFVAAVITNLTVQLWLKFAYIPKGHFEIQFQTRIFSSITYSKYTPVQAHTLFSSTGVDKE